MPSWVAPPFARSVERRLPLLDLLHEPLVRGRRHRHPPHTRLELVHAHRPRHHGVRRTLRERLRALGDRWQRRERADEKHHCHLNDRPEHRSSLSCKSLQPACRGQRPAVRAFAGTEGARVPSFAKAIPCAQAVMGNFRGPITRAQRPRVNFGAPLEEPAVDRLHFHAACLEGVPARTERSDRPTTRPRHPRQFAQNGSDARRDRSNKERSRRLRSIDLRRTSERGSNEADGPSSANAMRRTSISPPQ